MIEKSTIITKDTAIISQVAAKDSSSLNAKIDSIIIEEYTADDQGSSTPSANQHKRDHKVSSCQKRNGTSQNKTGSMKKTKIYGVNLSSTWSTNRDSLNKKIAHQQTTNSEIKQKTPIQTTTAGSKIIFVLIGITLLLYAGYVVWKNAVQ